jgi:hypothetical protein
MSLPHSCELSGVTLVSFRTQEFRLSYSHLASSTLLLGAVPWTLAVYFGGGSPFDMIVMMPLLGGSVTLLGLLPLWLYYHYEVGPDGIRGYDFWGRRVSLEWGTVTSARVRRIGGFPYALVQSPGAPTLWMPLSVNRSEAMEQCVLQHVSESHPVAVAIRTGLG